MVLRTKQRYRPADVGRRHIAIPEIAELRYYDARDARRRWGVNHKYGAIEVVPAEASAAVSVGTPEGR